MPRLRVKLRLRVAAGFALLGVAVNLALGGWLYLASSDLEQRLIDEALGAEMEDYQARLARNPSSLPPDTATIRGYIARPDGGGQIPAALRDLPSGRYTLDLDGVSYRILVRERPDGDLVMLHNRTQVARREERFALMVILGMTLTTLFSAAGGWWLAGRVIAPVRELAERVRGRDPAAGPMTAVDTAGDGLPHDEVGELAQTIEGYVQRLRAFVERERAFVSNASHELRTPLAVIQGAVEVLQADPRLDDRTQRRVDRIARATRGMTDLTTALLMLAREAQTSPPPTCAVHEVLAEVVDLHRPVLQHKPVVLECVVNARPILAVERPLLAIALGNLVRNACAYTEQGQIVATLDETQVRVDDTGPGIPADELGCLFEQDPGCRRQVRGEGIGLPLVKRIADHQGWRVSVTSHPGEGASFRLEFLPGPAAGAIGRPAFGESFTGS
jgi:signal transduction histidine kinase